MTVDPYQNCPCGSGKKLKWCCQKVAKFVEKADQLLEDDQVAAATQAVDEGLAVEPTNLWLRTVKARILLSTHDHDAAYPLLDTILSDSPGYRPALALRLEDQLMHGAGPQAVATFQEILESVPAAEAVATLGWMGLVGRMLSEIGLYFAALQHLRFVGRFEQWREESRRLLTQLEISADVPPWLKDTYELRPAPAGSGAIGTRWQQALEHAQAGRWRAAAGLFDAIASEQPSNAAAQFNLGICRGWLAESESAAATLERFARLESVDEAAVNALALAMCLNPRESEQTVDVVRVRFPIRDHSRLIQRLKDHSHFQVHVLDAQPDETEDGVKNEFFLLDKDRLDHADSLTLENAPQVVGSVRTRGPDLELEFADPIADDPRERTVREAAGDTIDSAGQREVAGTEPVSVHRLRRLWGMPHDTRPDLTFRVRRLANEHSLFHVWPDTPHGWLQNKTPREAAGVPDLNRHLRAVTLIEEYTIEAGQFGFDLNELRGQLGVASEPALEGDSVDVDHLPLARLRQARAATLPTPRLNTLFERSVQFSLTRAMQEAAEAIVARSTEIAEAIVVSAFRCLIEFARRRAERVATTEWLAKARAFDAAAGRPPRAAWDISEWLVSFELDRPEESVPRLVELLQKIGNDHDASQELSSLLLRLGLTRLVPHPSDPRKAIFDSRPLEYMIARFGARQPGALDLTPVGSGPGKIWTPDSEIRAAGSPIVLPGHEPASPQRSKLVIPGS